jgi:ADP-ribosyl-[dinitrogen reductase] hydrolase
MNIEDRKRGCFFGLAVGDALGAAVEFRKPGTFEPVTGYRSGGPHSLDAGQWTDDTSMALALADSLAKGFDPKDQLDKYVEWYQNGKYSVNHWCFDIGATTSESLDNYIRSGDPTTCGIDYEDASGNGSIMRLAPIPIKYANLFPDKTTELADLGEMSSVTTHASQKCECACRLMTVWLAAFIKGWSKEEVLHMGYSYWLTPKIKEIADGSFLKKEPPVIRGTGYVVDSLEAALWAFYKYDNFRDCVLAAVNLGEDADSTGAVCGQFAGAYYGYEGIPLEWREGLAEKDYIEGILKGIL